MLLANQFNELARIAADEGITVGYHNHWWEFGALDGTTALEGRGRIHKECLADRVELDGQSGVGLHRHSLDSRTTSVERRAKVFAS